MYDKLQRPQNTSGQGTFIKTNLATFEVTRSMFSYHYRIILETNINDIFKIFK